MKLLINIIIVGMFGIELCSPFMLGYLNKQDKKVKATNEYFSKRQETLQNNHHLIPAKLDNNWKNLDYSSNTYSDSKALQIKE